MLQNDISERFIRYVGICLISFVSLSMMKHYWGERWVWTTLPASQNWQIEKKKVSHCISYENSQWVYANSFLYIRRKTNTIYLVNTKATAICHGKCIIVYSWNVTANNEQQDHLHLTQQQLYVKNNHMEENSLPR